MTHIRIVAAWALALMTLSACSDPAGDQGPYAYQLKIKNQLKDPGSAQFQNENTYKVDGLKWAYCGEVNSKNSFGGYVGFRRVVVFGDTVLVEGDQLSDNSQTFEEAWYQICSLHSTKSSSDNSASSSS